MVKVNLSKDGEKSVEDHPTGVHVVPTEDGSWLYVYDEDGLTLAAYPKDNVLGVIVKAGETMASSENPR